MRLIFSIFLLLFSIQTYAKDALLSIPPLYISVAKQFDVSPQVLYAIARTESKHPSLSQPWPWTANVSGKPYYFNSRQDLTKFLKSVLRKNITTFDVGLMQINWRSHGDRFRRIEDAIDPITNLKAGADYLRYLINVTGSTDTAIGMYHTGKNGPKHRQKRYKSRVYDHLKNIKG